MKDFLKTVVGLIIFALLLPVMLLALTFNRCKVCGTSLEDNGWGEWVCPRCPQAPITKTKKKLAKVAKFRLLHQAHVKGGKEGVE